MYGKHTNRAVCAQGMGMDNPMVQAMMNNPDMLRQVMMSNPQLQRVMESNPQLAQILNDPVRPPRLCLPSLCHSLRSSRSLSGSRLPVFRGESTRLWTMCTF